MTAAIAALGWAAALGAVASTVITRWRMADRARAAARACHELRGPLTAARLGLELAARTRPRADPRVRAIELELGRATLAVDDLSRVWQRPGARTPWPPERSDEEVDIAGLLAASVEAWRPAAAASGAELRLIAGPGRPLVRGRALRLAQATGNLIANAIEHGGGLVEVSWCADRATVRIEVVDGGAGLAAPVADLILTRHSGHRLLDRRHFTGALGGGGWRRCERDVSARGHGLAIAAETAAAHGGRLASAPSERGARLVLELPAAQRTSARMPSV